MRYVKEYYARMRTAPSAFQILEEVDVSRDAFFRLFPRGLADACSEAGVPPPDVKAYDEVRYG